MKKREGKLWNVALLSQCRRHPVDVRVVCGLAFFFLIRMVPEATNLKKRVIGRSALKSTRKRMVYGTPSILPPPNLPSRRPGDLLARPASSGTCPSKYNFCPTGTVCLSKVDGNSQQGMPRVQKTIYRTFL